MNTVKEISKIAGISVRTLHYYDEIGLLAPAMVTEAGYRLYGGEELSRLQQILFLRELDFSLKDISAILNSPAYNRDTALAGHREILVKKRDRLNGLISLMDSIMKGNDEMSFKEFDVTEIEAVKEKYREEALLRWGNTQEYAQCKKKTEGYGKEDWQRISAEMDNIFSRLAGCMSEAPESPRVQELVEELRLHICRNYYECTDEILAGLGKMYTEDERFKNNIDRHGKGLAEFIGEAIAARQNL